MHHNTHSFLVIGASGKTGSRVYNTLKDNGFNVKGASRNGEVHFDWQAPETWAASLRDVDAVFVPVGGGGLLAGVAAFVKYVWPQTRVIGVEPADAACLKLALDKGRRATLPQVGLFADGCAVAQVGKETFRIIRDTVDEVITATTDEMCAAIKDIFEDTRGIAEPAASRRNTALSPCTVGRVATRSSSFLLRILSLHLPS